MVLVHVTTSKGCHKMQDRWENREYVVEKQPYPNISVYVVCPRDGEGTARPYIETICYPSTLTWGRAKQMNQLQCHLQTAFHKAVQIDLLLLDVALKPPGTNFPGGIEIFGC